MNGQNPKKTGNLKLKKDIQRFTISMDKDLLNELLKITKQGKKSRAVNIACREFVRMKQKENLLLLRGKVPLTLLQGE